jgi:hypothetical protein
MAVRLVGLLVVAALILATAVIPAVAQQFPNVANLKPFSAEAGFMSLPGYLRWLVFQQTGQWITYAEAARVVAEQVKTAGR